MGLLHSGAGRHPTERGRIRTWPGFPHYWNLPAHLLKHDGEWNAARAETCTVMGTVEGRVHGCLGAARACD